MKKPSRKFTGILAAPVLLLLLLSLAAAIAGELESRPEPERRASLGSGEHADPFGRAMPDAPRDAPSLPSGPHPRVPVLSILW